MNYTGTLHQWINSLGKTVACNNGTPSVNPAGAVATAVCGDIILAEAAYLDGNSGDGCTDGMTPYYQTNRRQWPRVFSYLQTVNRNHAFAVIDYLCSGYYPNNEPAAQVSWSSANFLLDRGAIAWYSARPRAAAIGLIIRLLISRHAELRRGA